MRGRLEEASPNTCSLELFGGVRFAFEDDGLPPPSSIEEVWPEGPHHALAIGWPFHLTVLPALSRACELTTDDGERAYTRHLQRGHVLGPPEPRQSEGRQRTRIEFEVDEEIFKDPGTTLDLHHLAGRVRDEAVLRPGLRTRLVDSIWQVTREFHYPAGLRDYLPEVDYYRLIADPTPLHGLIQEDGESAEMVVRFCHTGPARFLVFVNGERALKGGYPARGARRGLDERGLLRRETRTVGLTAVLSVWLHEPGWAGSTRAVSTSPRGRELCRRAAQALVPVPFPRLEP